MDNVTESQKKFITDLVKNVTAEAAYFAQIAAMIVTDAQIEEMLANGLSSRIVKEGYDCCAIQAANRLTEKWAAGNPAFADIKEQAEAKIEALKEALESGAAFEGLSKEDASFFITWLKGTRRTSPEQAREEAAEVNGLIESFKIARLAPANVIRRFQEPRLIAKIILNGNRFTSVTNSWKTR